MIEGGGGSLIHYLVGAGVKSIGVRCLERLVDEGSLDSGELKELVRLLDQYSSNEPALRDALCIEYFLSADLVDKFLVKVDGLADFDGIETLRKAAKLSGYIFQPNRTRLRMAETTRNQIAGMSLNYSQIEVAPEYADKSDFERFAEMIGPNFVGRFIARTLDYPVDSIANRKCSERLEIDGMRLLMALKAFKLERGELPASLEELAPAFIDPVPVDPYDGMPCVIPWKAGCFTLWAAIAGMMADPTNRCQAVTRPGKRAGCTARMRCTASISEGLSFVIIGRLCHICSGSKESAIRGPEYASKDSDPQGVCQHDDVGVSIKGLLYGLCRNQPECAEEAEG